MAEGMSVMSRMTCVRKVKFFEIIKIIFNVQKLIKLFTFMLICGSKFILFRCYKLCYNTLLPQLQAKL